MIYFSLWFRERALGLIFTVTKFPSFFWDSCVPLYSRGVLQGLVYLLFLPDPMLSLPFLFSWPYNLGLGTVFSTSPYYLGKRVIIIITTLVVVVIITILRERQNIWPVKVSVLGSRVSLKYEIQKLCSFLKSRDFYR